MLIYAVIFIVVISVTHVKRLNKKEAELSRRLRETRMDREHESVRYYVFVSAVCKLCLVVFMAYSCLL